MTTTVRRPPTDAERERNVRLETPVPDPKAAKPLSHLEWSKVVAREVRERYGFRAGSQEEHDLEQLAAYEVTRKWSDFVPEKAPPGDPEMAFRGWVHPSVFTACVREAIRLRNGGTFHTTRMKGVKMPEQGLPEDRDMPLEVTRRTAAPDGDGTPIALCSSADVAFTLHPVGLTVGGELDLSAWSEAFERLRLSNKSFLWALGDLAIYGLDNFGAAAARLIDATGYADETARKAEYVCRRFPLGNRFPTLSFKHHMAVAGLPLAQARQLLQRAEANRTSTRDLIDKVRLLREGVVVPDPCLALVRPARGLGRALADLDPAVRDRLELAAAANGVPLDGDRWPALEVVLRVVSALEPV